MPAERRLFLGWAAFAALNGALMLALPEHETIPFHFVWISLSIAYGIHPWPHRRTALVLVVVVTFSAVSIQRSVLSGRVDWQEVTEVPLMALVFLTMVWHVRRRMDAQAAAESMATSERRAHEVKELFVRSCSHEMRTPIMVARGYTELVRDAAGATEQTRADLDIVLDELSKLDHLTGRLVVLADAYKSGEFVLAPVDLCALLERTARRWRPTAPRRWLVEAEPVVVNGDAARLEAALDALVENAVKFTREGDLVVLRCEHRDGFAVVDVEDGGIGLAASVTSSGPPYTTGARGTGLGLAIVRAVGEGHRGRLETVELPSGGTRARLTLPVAGGSVARSGQAQVALG